MDLLNSNNLAEILIAVAVFDIKRRALALAV